jgi:hypothetical protein
MKVKITHPGLPDGYKMSLTGLNAILLNNEEVDVSDEAIAQYEAVTGKKFSEVVTGPAFGGEPVKRPTVEGVEKENATPEPDVHTDTFTNGVEE